MVEFWLFVLVTAGIYTIFSLGLLVQFGIAGLPNFGNGAFMAISAYTMAIAIVKFELPMIVAAPLGIAAAVLFGLVLAIPTVQAALRLSGDRHDRGRRDRSLPRAEPAGCDRRCGGDGQHPRARHCRRLQCRVAAGSARRSRACCRNWLASA